jgi:hypothetical protein
MRALVKRRRQTTERTRFVRYARADGGSISEIGQSDIGRNGQEQNKPLDPPLARDISNAKVDRVSGRFQPHLAARDFKIPSRVGSKTRERARQLFAP